MDMTLLLQVTLNGLMLGMIYIVVALGLTLIFSIMNVINFAHGEMYMLGGLVAYYFSEQLQIPYMLILVLAMILVGVFGIVVEKFFFRPFRGELLPALIVSLGLSMTIQTLTLLNFGTEDQSVSTVFPGMINFLGALFSKERLAIVITCIVFILSLYLLIQRSKIGCAIRAIAEDREAAALQGVNIDRICSFTFGLGCALAAAAGVLIAPVFYVNPYIGGLPLLKAFIIIILGGMGSLLGAVVGGLILGTVESFGTLFLSVPASNLLGFIIIILVLLFKPSGLFGHE
ncbi:MAG: branched-chain amino acid ABC transporter permease [Desulfobacterales bacterium]|nr:branched-chain amino acid ABC transporter permease [Desulfobacterales bacterium]